MTSPRGPRLILLGGLLAGALASCAIVQRPATDQPNAGLTLPAGFRAEIYASGFKKPRLMALAPNGDLFVSDTQSGEVSVLPDRDRSGQPDSRQVYAAGLYKPHGLAFHGGYLYVANTDGVVRFPYRDGDLKATAAPEKVVDLPPEGQHYSRTLVFGPDDRMYVAAGSTCNVCEESDPKRAAVWVYDADGKNGRPYATGLRNAVGLEWFGGALYATANGRDLAGGNIPPESFYVLRDGANYGWPYCYPLQKGAKQVWDKDFGRKDQAACDAAQPAFATTTAHAAPLGMAFYTATAFPGAYRNQMFVALHGSWNREPKSGYKVITVDPQTGETRDFLTGFLNGAATSGRPVDLQVAPDGALFLTEDGNGLIYRLSYAP
ncbi:PQQ-dependent sugar dehydrogenase [Deinococcus koreensis]|uniref:Sorbosone dehydrogenase n=1 Tax=Deinococcus koreensis TaxID=2054903 RepID=A0A2K3UTL6_9DEIO|nr:PQQ-dependent sugar dehydrogenase [Deinococcus koreensis]PNY79879.1 sorbosone dehydrogenase [Deinococcus koreensis]